MKIAVCSGKGGTGKTFVSTNLAKVLFATYIDSDIEEPNGSFYFENLREVATYPSYKAIPSFDLDKCIKCRTCVDFCHFNALLFIKDKIKFFPELCHSCMGCKVLCKTGAITESKERVGSITIKTNEEDIAIVGQMEIGQRNGGAIVKELFTFTNNREDYVIDCPPGTGCEVGEIIQASNLILVVTEPTLFGLENLKLIVSLIKLYKKPCFLVVNKENEKGYKPLEEFAKAEGLKIVTKIPYSVKTAIANAKGYRTTELKPYFDLIKKEVERYENPANN